MKNKLFLALLNVFLITTVFTQTSCSFQEDIYEDNILASTYSTLKVFEYLGADKKNLNLSREQFLYVTDFCKPAYGLLHDQTESEYDRSEFMHFWGKCLVYYANNPQYRTGSDFEKILNYTFLIKLDKQMRHLSKDRYGEKTVQKHLDQIEDYKNKTDFDYVLNLAIDIDYTNYDLEMQKIVKAMAETGISFDNTVKDLPKIYNEEIEKALYTLLLNLLKHGKHSIFTEELIQFYKAIKTHVEYDISDEELAFKLSMYISKYISSNRGMLKKIRSDEKNLQKFYDDKIKNIPLK